jgi:hypothetical protein
MDALACPDCQTPYAIDDNYCRRCGMYVAALRETTAVTRVQTTRALERPRAPMPAPMKKAMTAVAIGAAVQVGMTVFGKYLASQAAQKAVDGAVRAPRRRGSPNNRAVARHEPERAPSPMDDAAAVAETFLYRRVWIRRPD